MLQTAQRDHREFKGIRPSCHLVQPQAFFFLFLKLDPVGSPPVRILFHSGRSCVFPPAAWRGHVARRDLQQVKEARREAAICIQSGKSGISCVVAPSFLLDFIRVSAASNAFFSLPSTPFLSNPSSCALTLRGKGIKAP